MDITVNNNKVTCNKYINQETIFHIISMMISFVSLIATKQIFKLFFGLSANISMIIGFIVAEIVLFFLQKFFVYRDKGISSLSKEIIFSFIGSGIHLALYFLINYIFCNYLHLFEFTSFLIAFVLITILEYPFSKIIKFEFYNEAQKEPFTNLYCKLFNFRFVILSSLIALASIGFIYTVFKVFPFGDTTVLRMDLYHQYGPLFTELYDRITNADSFLYSWTSGGGSAFIGNFFNYLSSPLNILILLFNRDEMSYAISFLVALKCMISAATFTYYLKKSKNRHSIVSASFGVLYSFSAYFLAYFWNIMWLDAMFILPLIALGIENILNKNNAKLYTISLIYILFANYYMGFMICIFSVIYFLAYFLISNNSENTLCVKNPISKFNIINKINENFFISRGLKFAFSSLLAGLVCAFFLIPVFFILTGSSATSGTFPTEAESYFTLFDFIESHFAGLETTIRSSGNDILPNIYCGVFTLILLPLFLINKKIKTNEKFVYTSLLILFFIFFNNNFTNYIWHAFHFPNDLPYRFSFMYSFLLLVVCFISLMNLDGINLKDIIYVGIFWVGIIAIAQEFSNEKVSETSIYITLAFLVIWTGLLYLAKSEKGSKFIIGILVISVAFCEIIISDTNAFSLSQKQTDYMQSYETYTDDINNINENDDTLFRMELCDLNTRMDPCIYNYNGMSVFSSMAYENYSQMQYNLGMYGNRINSYTYNTQTPVYNMFYGIKYLICKEDKEIKPSNNLYTENYHSNDEKSIVYENNYNLPFIFGVNSELINWIPEEGNPFDVQNELFTISTGCSDVFIPVKYLTTNVNGFMYEEINENGNHWLTKNGDYNGCDIDIAPSQDGNLYIYIASSDFSSVKFTLNDKTIDQDVDTPYIIDLGYLTKNDTVNISLENTNSEATDVNFEIYAYTVNQDVLNEGYNKLLENSISINKYSDNKIEGTVDLNEDKLIYSSIPYDDGWNVYIDGEKTDKVKIADSQIGVFCNKGHHTIEYKYLPKGILISIPISAITIISIVICYIYKKKKIKDN